MDHAIMSACHSAFSNAGQKCSACSLFLVERSVYEREDFREKLRDCATSMKVGGVWNAGNVVGPMITNHNEKLLHAINNLEPGESWLVPPHFVDKKSYILAPSVKMGVSPQTIRSAPSSSDLCSPWLLSTHWRKLSTWSMVLTTD